MHHTLQEWEEKPICEPDFPEVEARQLHAAAERAARQLKLPRTAVLTRTHRGLEAGQVVGILQTPGTTLEILPKIDGQKKDGTRKALVHMLATIWNLNVAHGELARLLPQQNDILEFFVRLFAERLLAAVQRGLPRRYLEREEDLGLLRGRLDVTRQFTRLAVRPDRLACRFDELSENTPLNRVLKAAVSRLRQMTRSADNARLLIELSFRFESVRSSPAPLSERVRTDRSNTAFHDLYRLARLFLSGEWQSTTSGKIQTGFSLLFPMNDLFEEFVGQTLKRALAPDRVHLQHQGKHALARESVGHVFALRPDIVVDASDRPMVLDTKWKQLQPGDRKLGIKQSDVYQMLAYAQAYQAERLALIYPWHKDMKEPEGLYETLRLPESDQRLDVVTVDVSNPDGIEKTLRGYFEEIGKGDASALQNAH